MIPSMVLRGRGRQGYNVPVKGASMTNVFRFRILKALGFALCLTVVSLTAQDRKSVVHVPAGEATSIIEKALAAKQPQLAAASNYNVNVLRRAEAGTPEFHLTRTHVFFIQDGEATFVTGGSFEGQKEISPGEIRGTSIANGTVMQLRKGDVVVVPAATPHWFREVRPQITYYSVNIDQP
jgi:mannose-6-phosphate isomerase-like protein (cupin superfamily)